MIATTVVSTSMPVIVHDLSGDQAAYTWVTTAALLTTAISTPIWGKLGDLFDRKLLIQITLVLFVLATAAAGLAQDTNTLITFRAVEGLGAGGLAALSQVIIADIISPREQGRYMGLFGAVMAIATVGGPVLGGWITDMIYWRWNFFVAVPYALVILQKTLHIGTDRARRVSIDYLGIVLLAVAVSLLLIWVTNAGIGFDWWSVRTILMVGGALVATAAFIVAELTLRALHPPHPAPRPHLYPLDARVDLDRRRHIRHIGLPRPVHTAVPRCLPDRGQPDGPADDGGLLLSAIGVGQLVTHFGRWKGYLILGSVLLIAGSVLLSTLHYDRDFALVSVYMFLTGTSVGMTMQNLVLIVQNVAEPSEMDVCSSGVTLFRSLGDIIGVSAMGALLANRIVNLLTGGQEELAAAIARTGDRTAEVAAQLGSRTLPEVRLLPEPMRSLVEDFYVQEISHAFVIGIQLAMLSLVAFLFLPNTPLTRMTTSKRARADAAQATDPINNAAGTAIADAEALSGAPTGAVRTAGSGSDDTAASDFRR